MPPVILNPPLNGSTQGSNYYFSNTNAHGTHSAVPVTQWKATVTTGQNNGGITKTQTQWSTQPIQTCLVSNLPADNLFYYGQIVYQKPDGSTWVSTSSDF